VKFIFATTEIRKVPVTVLSRCQRFDLRRIEPEVMIAHLTRLATAEGAQVADDALALITRAAEGSVRDAVSLLDQAISHGAGETTADQVRAMLGLADRGRVLDLFDLIMRGDAAGALAELSAQYADGAEPAMVLRDLAEVTHWVSVIKITPEAAEDATVGPDERLRGQAMAAGLPMRVLTRMWQMLLKALEEVAEAPNTMMAAEMAVIRLTHVADLPDPEKLMRDMVDGRLAPTGAPATPAPGPGNGPQAQTARPAPRAGGGAGAALAAPAQHPQTQSLAVRYPDFEAVVALIRAQRDMKLLLEVETCLRLARYAPGRIEFQPTVDAPPDLAARLSQRLMGWTGQRWGVSVVGTGGAATIDEARNIERTEAEAEARHHPLVQAVLAAFPGARIGDIRTLETREAEAAVVALPEVEDEWDPFEDE
jgi:DNA polymerase-3 subunit gamma/tau